MGRLLLLLDLNGVLLYRSSAGSNLITLRNSGSQVINSKLVLRPFLSEFLSFCFKYFDVGIWASLKATNAYPLVARILGPNVDIYHPELIVDDGVIDSFFACSNITNLKEIDRLINKAKTIESIEERQRYLAKISVFGHRILSSTSSVERDIISGKLSLLWTQSRCNIVKEGDAFMMKYSRPFMLKNLSSIWHYSPDALEHIPLKHIVENIVINTDNDSYLFSDVKQREYDELTISCPSEIKMPNTWNKLSTLLIDDSSYKFSQTPLNGITISSFNENSSNDRELLYLKEYLSMFIIPYTSEADFDIRKTIKENPYSSFIAPSARE